MSFRATSGGGRFKTVILRNEFVSGGELKVLYLPVPARSSADRATAFNGN